MPQQMEAGSFRDPAGFVFKKGKTIYRQINRSYRQEYSRLMESGLYADLVDQGLLVSHQECSVAAPRSDVALRVIRPRQLDFMSWPYEWCFSQLQQAALATLRIQRRALQSGMWLKDASAYNIQFQGNQPLLIDTLSFGLYEPNRPWPAYRQFCQHFLAPLVLAAYRDVSLIRLLALHLDGIPLPLASRLLPGRTRFSLSLLSHIHFHAHGQEHFSKNPAGKRAYTVRETALQALLDNLESSVRRMSLKKKRSIWSHYYGLTNYSEAGLAHKEQVVVELLNRCGPGMVWDLGANSGRFSRLATGGGRQVVAFDADPLAVEIGFRQCVAAGESAVLPLVMDLTNPSPGIGWANRERASLLERGPAATVLALALIHHLAIGNNLPLEAIARFLRSVCTFLIIEFVPKQDSQVQRLLSVRPDIFPDYREAVFRRTFAASFRLLERRSIRDSGRTLYLMQAK